MYKKNPLSMLREKRRHASQKPNRRLDAKSSRGMIYENEELRLRTININAEVERGQSEIKNLKKEREILRREIWTLRDEYDKLEKILQMKGIDIDEHLNCNNQSKNEENEEDCSSCSCSSEEDEDPEQLISGGTASACVESTQALQQNQKNSEELMKSKDRLERLHVNFDHLSIVSEENSDGNSSNFLTDETVCASDTVATYLSKVDAVSPLNYYQTMVPSLSHFENLPYEAMGLNEVHTGTSANSREIKMTNSSVYKPFPREENQAQSGSKQPPKHFFAPIRKGQIPPVVNNNQPDIFFNNVLPNNMFKDPQSNLTVNCSSTTTVVNPNNGSISPTSSFQTGGNLEELLYDIETLSKDILELQTQCQHSPQKAVDESIKKPFRSELNLFLTYHNDKQHTNGMMEHLPSPFPTNPSSPITPPTNFNPNDPNFFEADRIKHINFPPYNAPLTGISSNNSVFCTVSAPSTPASSRKEIEKFPQGEIGPAPVEESDSTLQKEDTIDKKKSKRVSYLQNTKEEQSAVPDQTTEKSVDKDCKESLKDKKPTVIENGSNNHTHHHSHVHSNKLINNRRMSLDTTLQQSPSSRTRHANHRAVGQEQTTNKVVRNNSNRSYTLVKKRSRSDSTFGNDHQNEGGTSMSERNSNSLASSRESSTSLSLKSQSKRRISITSHGTGSKIPWCACWGNGCI